MKGWRHLDGRLPAGYAQGSLLLGTEGKQTQSLVGLGGRGGHQLAVDVAAILVVDADLETMSEKDLWFCRVTWGGTRIDTSPGIPKLSKLPLAQEA